MPRLSKIEKLERRMIEQLEAKAFDASIPEYVQARYMATLSTMLRRRDKRLAEKAARRTAVEKAEAPTFYNVLPDNGRAGTSKQAPPRPINPDWLPRPGESPAMTRARLEKLAEQAAS
jgi:hypothetical protein